MKRRTRNPWIAIGAGALLAAVAGSASAQVPGWNVEVVYAPGQTRLLPQAPSCTVRALARFSPNDFAMAGARWEILASEPGWSDAWCLSPFCTCNPGARVEGPRVHGCGGQLNFPQANIFADPSNPLPTLQAKWTATEFTPRTVTIRTLNTTRFDVYLLRSSSASASRLAGLTEGVAEIEVGERLCYADCDTTTGPGVLDVFDFLCFQNRYEAGAPYACDCDSTTGPGACDIFDFLCFQNSFDAGCP